MDRKSFRPFEMKFFTLILACLLLADTCYSYPFEKGNGRKSRVIQSLFVSFSPLSCGDDIVKYFSQRTYFQLFRQVCNCVVQCLSSIHLLFFSHHPPALVIARKISIARSGMIRIIFGCLSIF